MILKANLTFPLKHLMALVNMLQQQMLFSYYHGAFDGGNVLWMKQNGNLNSLREKFARDARKQKDDNDGDFDKDVKEMEKCMSHFDKVLEEQSTHPINETKLHDKQRIEGKITGQTDRDGSLSEGIKKDEGGYIMQRDDLDGNEGF